MSNQANLSVADRIAQLMNHLGIERAHLAGRLPADWLGSAQDYPERLLSLTLACPPAIPPAIVDGLADKLLVISGDEGPHAENVKRTVEAVPTVPLTILPDYSNVPWTDVAADHPDQFGQNLLTFLSERSSPSTDSIRPPAEDDGEVAGLAYRIQGSGPALILLPLGLAPSQWDPLIPLLSEHYCTILLGGAHLGYVAMLEERGTSAGYVNMFRNLIAATALQPGQSVLDVGTGSGVSSRCLAHDTDHANPITAIDINRYLLREATGLAKREGLSDVISFEEASAEELPMPDDSFDLTFSVTVVEEGDADRMLAEMVRVTKPGGKVAVIARARDIPFVVNLPLRAELKDKAERSPHGGIAPKGCADASLYERMQDVGLTHLEKFPQLTAFDLGHPININHVQNFYIFTGIDQTEQAEWHEARASAGDTFFVSAPHHCAVGTKPK